MPLAEPLRHQRELSRQHLAVVRRKLGGSALPSHLNIGEHRERLAVEPLGIVPGVEPGEVVRAAEVLEQQQALAASLSCT